MTVDVTTMHPNKDCGMSLTNVGQTLRGVYSTHVSTSPSFTRCVLEYAPHAAKSVRPYTIFVRLTCDCVGHHHNMKVMIDTD